MARISSEFIGIIRNLEQFLFYFLFFAIPFQTRKILYSPGWYYNEWQAVSIYATDLILLALFIFWAVDKRHVKSVINKLIYYDYFLLGFLVMALVSVKNSSDFYSGFFLWLKLVEFAAFYFYLKTYALKRFELKKVSLALIAGGTFQAVIGIAQFLKQSDLGLRYLGESVLDTSMNGVAVFINALGEKVLRVYGTTPHPNVLAAYLLLAIFAFYFLYLYRELSANRPISKKPDLLMMTAYTIMLFGFLFTFSRVVIFLWLATFILRASIVLCKEKLRRPLLYMRNNRMKLVKILLVSLMVIVVFSVLYWPEVRSRAVVSSDEEAVKLRVFYNKESLNGGINLFGIGLGDFTSWLMEQNPNLPRYAYQPVHNIYLLIYSEIGIVGLVLFLLFLVSLIYEFIKKTKLLELWYYSFILVALSILFIGLFDHFLLTLQQGRFILWLGLTLLSISDIIKQQSKPTA